jgi:hypothetical protein
MRIQQGGHLVKLTAVYPPTQQSPGYIHKLPAIILCTIGVSTSQMEPTGQIRL